MVDIPLPPFRRAFDAARDPLTARNALGITTTGGGGSGFITAVTAPLQVTGTTLSIDLSAYLTSATAAATYQPLDADLTAIAALTGTNTIYYRSAANTWSAVTVGTGLSFSGGTLTATGGGGGGNVSNSGTPTSGQYAKWVTATTIEGVAPATVLSDIGAQPLDGDLTAIAALTGTNTIYYRSASNTWSAVTIGTGLTFTGGTLAASGGGSGISLLYNYIGGLALSNGPSDTVNDITIAPGQAADSTNTVMMSLTGALTKQLDAAWAVGTNAGGRDTGAIADGTWHVFLIYNPTGPAVDMLFSASVSAPTLPGGYTLFRRVGSIMRIAASITLFRQTGNMFVHSTPIFDVNVTQSAARSSHVLTVPTNILPLALIRILTNNTSSTSITVICDPAEPDVAPSATATPLASIYCTPTANGLQEMQIRTNASSQICARPNVGSTVIRMTTTGWIDHRGYV